MMYGNNHCLFSLKGNFHFATGKVTTNLKVCRRTKSFLRRLGMDNNIVSLDYLSQLRLKSFNGHATKDVRIDQDCLITMRSNIVYHHTIIFLFANICIYIFTRWISDQILIPTILQRTTVYLIFNNHSFLWWH